MRLKSRYQPEQQLSECLTGPAGSISKLTHHSYSYWPEASVLCHVILSTGHGVSELRERAITKKKKKKQNLLCDSHNLWEGQSITLGNSTGKNEKESAIRLVMTNSLRFHELSPTIGFSKQEYWIG